jgi:hypothetical protein
VSCILFDVVISIVVGIFASHINNWVHLGGFLSGFCIAVFVHFDNFDGRNLLAARHHQVEYCEVSGVLITSDQNMRQGGHDDQNIPSEISVDEISVETEVKNHAYMIIEVRNNSYMLLYGDLNYLKINIHVLTFACCVQQDASELVRKEETPLLGRRVVINGLVAKPELNGRTGTAVSFDDAKGRYSVELDDTSSSFMIKPCNLLPMVCSVAPCSLLFSHVQTLPRLS